MVIKALWERIGREVDKKIYTPRAVVHISANVSPEDIKLTGANQSKVKYIASGSTTLRHPRKLALCKEMEKAANELRSYLPVLLGMGVQCVLPTIVDEQLDQYDGILNADRDEREGEADQVWYCQILHQNLKRKIRLVKALCLSLRFYSRHSNNIDP